RRRGWAARDVLARGGARALRFHPEPATGARRRPGASLSVQPLRRPERRALTGSVALRRARGQSAPLGKRRPRGPARSPRRPHRPAAPAPTFLLPKVDGGNAPDVGARGLRLSVLHVRIHVPAVSLGVARSVRARRYARSSA